MPERHENLADRDNVIRNPHRKVDLGEPGVAASEKPAWLVEPTEAPEAEAARAKIAEQGFGKHEIAMMHGLAVGQEVWNPGYSSEDPVETGYTVSKIRDDGMVEISRPRLNERGEDTGSRSRAAYPADKIVGVQPKFLLGEFVNFEDSEGRFGKWEVMNVFPASGAVEIRSLNSPDHKHHVVSAAVLERLQPQQDTATGASAGRTLERAPQPKPKRPRRTWRNGFGLFS